MGIEDMVFVGLNGYILALQRDTGDILWQWETQTWKGYVTLLVDRDRIVASVNGYMYCLDALTGEQLWHNPLSGYGTGVASVATSGQSALGALQAQASQAVEASGAAAAVVAAS